MKDYQDRLIEKSIQHASESFAVVMLTGPRQVGKTTVLKNCSSKERKYVTLDNLVDRRLAIEDPQLFLQKHGLPLFIDEVQYAPGLFPILKWIVDQRQEKGLFWLTGSQQFNLMKGVSESLAGRIAILKLQGFSQRERFQFLQRANFWEQKVELENLVPQLHLMDFYKIIWRGSAPELVLSPKIDWEMFYDSYIQTYIERDVRQLGTITNTLAFMQFMRALAARTGQLLNYSDLARDVGISNPTAKAWVSILQASGIVYLLEPYYANLTNRMTKMPKVYFLDTGLACYLTHWQTPETLESGAMSGAIFETYVISEILKSFWFSGKRAPLFFYRDKDLREIDLIIELDGQIIPIEIKKKTAPDRSDIKHFSVIDYTQGFVICFAQASSLITEKITMLPVGCL